MLAKDLETFNDDACLHEYLAAHKSRTDKGDGCQTPRGFSEF